MPKKDRVIDLFHDERRKIRESGILDALIQYVEGKRDLSSSQVSAALGLLKKAVSDLSTFVPPEEGGSASSAVLKSNPTDKTVIEIRIVDPPR